MIRRDAPRVALHPGGDDMPIYAFRCEACNHKFDELVSISQNVKPVCPKCHGEARRVYEGKCAFGAKSSQSGKSCSGSCSGCAGCGH